MRFELFVALRYLLAKREQAFISVISVIAIAGVALGVASLIVVMGVMNGFATDLREKIMGVNAHVMAVGLGSGNLMQSTPELMDKVQSVPGVTKVMPFIYSEVMISGRHGAKGLVLRGVDPASASDVLGITAHVVRGSFAELGSAEGLPGIVVGLELAKRIGAFPGSRVNLLTPSAESGGAGFAPRIRPFRVAAIFSTGMFEYDSSLGLISLEAARSQLGIAGDDMVNGLQIMVADIYEADKVAAAVGQVLGPQVSMRNWMEMNANLFAALKLEKIGMAIMFTLIVLVGSFSIVTALVVLVMEKTRDIAILMSMGATGKSIRRIFMLQGSIIGAAGTGIGFALGLAVCFLLKRYKFIALPKGVYSTDYLPVLLVWSDLVLIGLGAMILCFLATLYPARQAAGLRPVEALRYE
jgi:lipoprotein-releasing system permease protein